ncbi:MAG: hypothetical protein Udaeo_01240 [Candidatus Udaeobacter sp.]|nr:MAG: hypothetical protein Udaeo_01240 [Candidatus Udaeobacter sp.]
MEGSPGPPAAATLGAPSPRRAGSGRALPKSIRSINLPSSRLSAGIWCSDIFNATRSRAFPEAWLSRPAARSISRIDFNSVRIDPSRSGSCKSWPIISWRPCSLVRSRNGCRIHARNLRAPIGVMVRSSTLSKLASRAPRDSTSSRLACVAESSRT